MAMWVQRLAVPYSAQPLVTKFLAPITIEDGTLAETLIEGGTALKSLSLTVNVSSITTK
jgi:hypothetical protein